MNTQNIHHFPLNLSLLLIFGALCVLPFSALYMFGVEKNNMVLGTSSTVINDVTLVQSTNSNATEFKYSLSPFEEKQINVFGSKVYLKQAYEGVQFNVVENTLYIKNLTPNSYLVEGVVF